MFQGNQQKVVELMAVFKLSPSGSQLSLELEAKIVKKKLFLLMPKAFKKRLFSPKFVSFPDLTLRTNDAQDGGRISVSNIVLIDDFRCHQ